MPEAHAHKQNINPVGPRAAWLPALHELAAAVAAGGVADELLTRVAQRAAELCRAESASLFQWDMWNGVLQPVARSAESGSTVDPGEELARAIWERGEALRIDDYQRWPGAGVSARRHGVRSGLGVPVRVSGYRAGALVVLRYVDRSPFSVEDELLLGLLALQASHVIERSRAEEALQASESHLRSLMQHTSDLVSVLDPDGTVRYVSPSILRVMGYPPQAIIGATAFGAIHPDDVDRVRRVFGEVARTAGAVRAIEFQRQRRDGTWMHVEAIFHNLLDDPDVRGIVMNSHDITERKQAAEVLKHQALHDALTGLPNRALLHDRLQHAIKSAAREGAHLALLKLDLDHFRQINDSFGHQTGDQLLQQAIPRLRANLRGADTVARLGGVEFAVLLPDAGLAGAMLTARKLLVALERPFEVGEHRLTLGANLGIAIYPDHGADAGSLMRHAELALATAMRKGSGFSIYAPSHDEPRVSARPKA